MGEALMVGMAEIKATQSHEDVLIALGVGSCISICAYEPDARIAAMAYIVLPDSEGHEDDPGTFADTAVPLLLQTIEGMGGNAALTRIALAGGAELFTFAGSGSRLEIGPRNATAVRAALKKHDLCVLAADLGGSAGRTVHLTGDGRVRVKVPGRGEHELACLARPV